MRCEARLPIQPIGEMLHQGAGEGRRVTGHRFGGPGDERGEEGRGFTLRQGRVQAQGFTQQSPALLELPAAVFPPGN